jgi:ribosomal protein S18 acetylase RimI-like enzyme
MESIRAAQLDDAAGIARVHVDSWRTTYKGIIPGEFLATLSYARQEQSWQQILNDPAQVTFVAVDEAGTIVGFVNGGPEREGDPAYQGELYAIYVLQEAQGHGLGRRLVKELTRLLAERHFESMMLWVLASNPACRFYEALGGQVIKQKQHQIGGASYDELAYGWQDLSLLLQL